MSTLGRFTFRQKVAPFVCISPCLFVARRRQRCHDDSDCAAHPKISPAVAIRCRDTYWRTFSGPLNWAIATGSDRSIEIKGALTASRRFFQRLGRRPSQSVWAIITRRSSSPRGDVAVAYDASSRAKLAHRSMVRSWVLEYKRIDVQPMAMFCSR